MEELSGEISGGTTAGADAAPASATSVTPSQDSVAIGQDATEGEATTVGGSIPTEKHIRAIENARRKAAEEVESRYAHVRDIDADSVRQWRSWTQMLDTDPEGALHILTRQLQRMGRLQVPQRAGQPSADPEPQPDLKTEDGQFVYSAPQAKRYWEWRERQLEQRMVEKITPLQQGMQQRELEQQVSTQATTELHYMRSTLPYFKEHEKEIKDLCSRDGRYSVRGAYDKIVLPKIRQLERESVVKELNTKASAGSINPASPSTVTHKDAQKMSWGELFRAEFAKHAGK